MLILILITYLETKKGMEKCLGYDFNFFQNINFSDVAFDELLPVF